MALPTPTASVNRFGDALLFLVAQKMRALERSSRSAVTVASLLEGAWRLSLFLGEAL